ncbi:MAG: putative glycoside hydrolase [Rikenellaceae bacterium]
MKNVFLALLMVVTLSCTEETEFSDSLLTRSDAQSTLLDEDGEYENPAFPVWSWDKIQVNMHFSTRGESTDYELWAMARHPFITLEKQEGEWLYEDTAMGAYAQTKKLKALNPYIKVLFYWNSRTDIWSYYSGYSMLELEHELAHPEWAHMDQNGDTIWLRGTTKNFDASNEDFRDWWQIKPYEAVTYGAMDGVFIDAIQQHFATDNNLAEGEYEKDVEGVEDMMRSLDRNLGTSKIVIANNIHYGETRPVDLTQYTDGSFQEHFYRKNSTTPDEVLENIKICQDEASQGRIFIAKCWPRYYYRNYGSYDDTDEEMEENTRLDIVYPLACYLVAMGKYSYFAYSHGYTNSTGALIDFEEYDKHLGKPYGPAVQDGYIFTRQFEHANVWVDVENELATIDWVGDNLL